MKKQTNITAKLIEKFDKELLNILSVDLKVKRNNNQIIGKSPLGIASLLVA